MTIIQTSRRAAEEAATALAEVKGREILLIDVAQSSSFADYFVVATGESSVHMRALADRVRKAMAKSHSSIKHAEGRESQNWILLDYSDVVVHIFSKPARNYYALETLWGDESIIQWDDASPIEAKSFNQERRQKAWP